MYENNFHPPRNNFLAPRKISHAAQNNFEAREKAGDGGERMFLVGKWQLSVTSVRDKMLKINEYDR